MRPPGFGRCFRRRNQANSLSLTTRSKFSFVHLMRYGGSSLSAGSSRITLHLPGRAPERCGMKSSAWPILNLCSDMIILRLVRCEARQCGRHRGAQFDEDRTSCYDQQDRTAVLTAKDLLPGPARRSHALSHLNSMVPDSRTVADVAP